MSLLVVGKVERLTERQAGTPGNTWTETTVVVKDWGQTLYVVAGRELAEAGLPREGEGVALEVGVRPYVKRDGSGAGFGLTAFRRHAETEAAVFGGSQVRAVS